MSKSKARNIRKKRRAISAILKWGRSARPTHKLQGGRTGGVHTKKLKSLLN